MAIPSVETVTYSRGDSLLKIEWNPDQPGMRHCQKDAVAHDWEEVVDRAGALLLAVGAV